MKFIGIDFHKNYSFITEMDENGVVQHQTRLSNDRDSLKRYIVALPTDSKIAIEATCNWYYFYELIEEHHLDIFLAHPLKTKAIAAARLMNDKVSSETLAHLLRANLLPTAYIPDQPTRDIREILRMYAFLVSQRTRLKNRVHAILMKNGLVCPFVDVFGRSSQHWLNNPQLRPCYQESLISYCRLAESLNNEIHLLQQKIKDLAYEHPYARILDAHPGISHYSGLLIAVEIGDINRFPNAGKYARMQG